MDPVVSPSGAAAVSSRRGTSSTRSPCATARSSRRPATRAASRSCARRRSRFQALPLVRARDDLDDGELAIASASHLASPSSSPPCGPAREGAGGRRTSSSAGPRAPPSRLQHNCSGKHAGMLALCRAKGWPSGGYRLAGPPASSTAACTRSPRRPTSTRTRSRRRSTAAASSRSRCRSSGWRSRSRGSSSSTAAPAWRRAMRAHPELIRGPARRTRCSCASSTGWIAKGGAEGLLCAAGPTGSGSRSRSRTAACARCGPALAELLSPARARDGRARRRAARELARRARRRDHVGPVRSRLKFGFSKCRGPV